MSHAVRAALVPFLLALLLAPSPSRGQVSTSVASVGPDDAVAGSPVSIQVELRQVEDIQIVYLVYRPFGTSEYRREEMVLTGSSASFTLPPGAVTPPFIEYYLILARGSGAMETYPVSESPDPMSTPPANTLRLTIRPSDAGTQILFLSPDVTEITYPDEVVISISLLRADSTVVPQATRVSLDGTEITSGLFISDDLLVYSPSAQGVTLSPGVHDVSVRLYDRDGNLAGSATHRFSVRGEAVSSSAEPMGLSLRSNATLNFETRRERVGNAAAWYNRGGFQFSGRRDEWRFMSNVFVTSDEDPARQPQNRFYFGVESPWLLLGAGDAYPIFPSLIMSGKRIRGATGALRLGFFNVEAAWGQTVRPIEGALLGQFPVDSLTAEQLRNPADSYAPVSDSTWGRFRYGTYERTLFAVRPSFSSGEAFQLGFTWLAGSDRTGSISYGSRPQENVVIGSDLSAKLDGESLVLTGQVAFSAFNRDISSGSFTDEYIDTVFTDPDAIREARDILSRVITVNENLVPLSLETLPTLAYEVGLAIDYFGNALRGTYLYRGSEYMSFGQTFLRTDIQGFTLVDRLRLFNNRFLLTLGVERLQDNTANSRPYTTTFSTINAGVSLYPGPDLPGLTAGYTRYWSRNDRDAAGPDSLSAIDDVTNRIYVQSSYDFVLGIRHTAMAALSLSNRNDRTVRRTDLTNNSATISIQSRFPFPLQTVLDIGIYTNDLQRTTGEITTLNYTTVSVGARYALPAPRVTFFGTIAPTFGELRRTSFDLGAEWVIQTGMALVGHFSYFKNNGSLDDSYASIRIRYDI